MHWNYSSTACLTRSDVCFEESACLDRIVEKAWVKPATPFIGCDPRSQSFVIQKDLVTFGFAKVAPSEVIRKISQNFSPAGVTSPFVARAIPTDNTSVVPVSGR